MKAFVTVVSVDRSVGRRARYTRQYAEEAEIHKRRAEGARGARAAGRGPRPAAPARYTTTGQYEVSRRHRASTYTLQSARRVAETSRPLLNRNTHTVDEQRCIVRVECGPSYRFAYLLLPLQHVRHRDVFGEVHLAVEHDALAEDRRDVYSILMVLVAGHCCVTDFINMCTIFGFCLHSNVTSMYMYVIASRYLCFALIAHRYLSKC